MTEDPNSTGHSRRAQPLFFPVSITKLLVLSLVTFHLYEMYWFYQHWRVYKERTGARITPIARSIFAEFFCYSLFRKIRETAAAHGVSATFSPGLIAIGWIVLFLLARAQGIIGLLSHLSPLLLVPVQRAVNRLNEKEAPDHLRNHRLSGWNIVVIVIWGLFRVLEIVGSLLPDQPH